VIPKASFAWLTETENNVEEPLRMAETKIKIEIS
jgi:hypothetical protein